MTAPRPAGGTPGHTAFAIAARRWDATGRAGMLLCDADWRVPLDIDAETADQ